MLSTEVLKRQSWRNSLTSSDKEYMERVLEKLPEDSRLVIFLHYWRDFELKDIADVMGTCLKEVELIHNMTLQLLSKAFGKTSENEKRQSREVTA